MKKHKEYSANFKSEVVKEILRKEKSLSQISSEYKVHPTEYKVHPTQLNRWKTRVAEKLIEKRRYGKM